MIILTLQESFGDDEDKGGDDDDDDVLDLVADDEEELYITLDDYQDNGKDESADQEKSTDIESNLDQIQNSGKEKITMDSEKSGSIEMEDVKETESKVNAQKTGLSAQPTPGKVTTGEITLFYVCRIHYNIIFFDLRFA